MSTPPRALEQEPPSSGRKPKRRDSERKFTRGEKCLFTHLVATFSFILLCVIIFSIHLILVHHTKQSLLKFSRRTDDDKIIERRDLPLGYLYLSTNPVKSTCNALLLRSRWSVAPGHCTAMRSDPDMSSLLYAWRIKYRTQGMEYIESEIKRSIPHPHFDRNDFSNNIGVIEHVDPIEIDQYVFPDSFPINVVDFLQNSNKLEMIGWEQESTNDDEHGAILLMDSNIVGFFSWGERGGKEVPFIVINILHYKEWLENMVSIATLS